MTQILSTEEKEYSKPILLIYGFSSLLQRTFLNLNFRKFRIILVADKRPSNFSDYPDAYFVSYENTLLLPKLAETIDYAIINLNNKNAISANFLFEKIRKDKAKSIVTIRHYNLSKLTGLVNSFASLPIVKIGIYGEVLTRKKGEPKADLSKIIENAIQNREITVNGEQIIPVYGITLHDFATALHRLLFGKFKNDSIYLLFYRNPQTILEAAHLIARVDPEIALKFTGEISEIKYSDRKSLYSFIQSFIPRELVYPETVLEGFEKGLPVLFKEEKEAEEEKATPKKKSKRNLQNVANPLKFALSTFFAGIFLFLLLNALVLASGIMLFRNSLINVQQGNFKEASQEVKVAKFLLGITKPFVELAIPIVETIDTNHNVYSTYSLIERGVELVEITGETVSLISDQKNITEKKIAATAANISYLYQEGQRVYLATGNKQISEQLKENYAKLLTFTSVLPDLLGFKEEKKYLLLFQNSDELRPTGGFVGSVGELSISNGKIKDLKIQDVYELDGQLRNHIEPPFVVRRYLQPHLFLRDSNFYLNYQEAASTAAKIYYLESGNKPSGVIAVNLEVLRKIMEITGPIYMPSFNVTVDKESVSQFLHSTIHKNFFPGSTQKKDVLNSLFTQIIEKSEKDQKFNIALIKLLPKMLEDKDIQASFQDESIQKVFSANNYAGELKDSRKMEKNDIYDFIYINEANIGVNKVNAKVLRQVNYETVIGQGNFSSKAELTIENSSKDDDYTSYIQLVVPSKSYIKKILFDGVEQKLTNAVIDPVVYEAKNFIKPDELEVEQYEKDNRTIIAFIAKMAKGKNSTITVEYENGSYKPLTPSVKYSLLILKQPGIKPYDFTTTISYPEGYTPTNTAADKYGNNFLEKNLKVVKDTIYNIQLMQ